MTVRLFLCLLWIRTGCTGLWAGNIGNLGRLYWDYMQVTVDLQQVVRDLQAVVCTGFKDRLYFFCTGSAVHANCTGFIAGFTGIASRLQVVLDFW
jgi:hypothetical protein